MFGSTERRPVHAVTLGLETDEEALIFHGSNGREFNVAEFKVAACVDKEAMSEDATKQIVERLQSLYPDMKGEMLRDLIPLVVGNICHIQKIRTSGRPPVELEHRENCICAGRGFASLHLPNKALIVGPYSHEWPSAVKTAGTIVAGNLRDARISSDNGILLLVAALYLEEEEGAFGWKLKEEKVRYLLREAERSLKEGVPELTPQLSVLAGVVDANTRKFHPLPPNITS